ncbi:MAG TPA: condensation domain-containing protein, partial [Longimicrobium sp.]
GGEVEFLGRLDDQVKVRGFRIELGEVEAALARQAGVRAAAAAVRGEGAERRLVGYVVAEAGTRGEAVREAVRRELPEAMVPQVVMLLERLPLASTGKLDRAALPQPEAVPERAGEGPRSAAEEAICAAWAEVLRRGSVGVHDNFFELGGDSIQGIQVISRLARRGVRVTARQLFQHQTVAELAAVAGRVRTADAEQGSISGPAPLTPIQRRFFDFGLADPHHYNQTMLLAARERLDPERLERAVARLLDHHDALRLRFVRDEGGWRQEGTEPGGEVPFQVVELAAIPAGERSAALEAAAAGLQAGLELSTSPLVRVALFDLGADEPQRLLFVVHHLVVDGLSWRILLEDLEAAYRGEALAPKTTPFREWGERLAEHARTAPLQDELGFWLAQGAGRAAGALPCDGPGGANTVGSSQTLAVALDAGETDALLHSVPHAYRTQIDDVLLAALVEAFAELTGGRELRVSLEGHGREPLFDDVDLSRSVGWFTSIYPVSLSLEGAGGPGEVLKAVKEQLRRIPQRGVGFGVLRYLAGSGPAAALAELPAPAVGFNYLGRFDQTFAADTLFHPARESRGPSRSPRGARAQAIEVNAHVTDGTLQVGWTFSTALHRRSTVEALAAAYMARLRALIDHCLSPEAGGVTPSDFPGARVDQAELDALLAVIGA